MDDSKQREEKQHSLSLNNREYLKMSGVLDVSNFNDSTIEISTEIGNLVIKGKELHISNLNIDDGNVMIKGYIQSFVYDDNVPSMKEKSFFKNIFK